MRHIEVTPGEDAHVAALHWRPFGPLDELREEFGRLAMVAPPFLVVDLQEVVTTDGGLRGLLVGLSRQLCKRGGELVLSGVSPHVQEELDVLHLTKVFEVTETCEGAWSRLRERRRGE
jgi:anti-anti-sigma regulatory factor